MPDQAERTSFDLFEEYDDGARLFAELKPTEGHCGLAQADKSHLRKRAEVYLPRLAGKVRPEFLEQPHCLGKLPRQVDSGDWDSGRAVVLGKKWSGGARPRPSWGRSVL